MITFFWHFSLVGERNIKNSNSLSQTILESLGSDHSAINVHKESVYSSQQDIWSVNFTLNSNYKCTYVGSEVRPAFSIIA